MATRAGYSPEQKIRPAFLVAPFEGEYERTIVKRSPKGLVQEKVKTSGGYLVTFPKYGNSIHVTNDEELARLGFDNSVPLVDDDGEVVGVIPNSVTSANKKG